MTNSENKNSDKVTEQTEDLDKATEQNKDLDKAMEHVLRRGLKNIKTNKNATERFIEATSKIEALINKLTGEELTALYYILVERSPIHIKLLYSKLQNYRPVK